MDFWFRNAVCIATPSHHKPLGLLVPADFALMMVVRGGPVSGYAQDRPREGTSDLFPKLAAFPNMFMNMLRLVSKEGQS